MIKPLTADELQDITDRLNQLGYEVVEADTIPLNFCRLAVKQNILNDINAKELPIELYHLFIDMTCGEFLRLKQGSNQLDGFDIDGAINSISMGDVSVSYNSDMSIAEKFSKLLEILTEPRKGDMACFRKIRW